MNQNGKKNFTDQFYNENGSYHIPTWTIVVGFIVNWVLGMALLVARLCEDKTQNFESPYEACGENETVYETQKTHVYTDESERTVQREKQTTKRTTARKNGKKSGEFKKKINTDKFWLVLGILVTLTAVTSLPDSIQYLVWCIQDGSGISYGLEEVISDALWLISGVVMLLVSAGMRKAKRNRNRIVAIVGDADYIAVDEIAEALPASRGKTERLLQRCIDYGMFGNRAYLDMRSDCLVVRGSAPMSKKERAEKEAAELAAKLAAENLDEYEKVLKELREINDRIPGEEMSVKISRLEDLTAKIFKLAKEYPEKLGSMKKFMNYYLPTSLNLLRRYERLDAQGIEGENISEAKKQIEDTMDTMVAAFEKQLDKLFASEGMDIAADIAAMQNLMRADGLVDDELTDKFS